MLDKKEIDFYCFYNKTIEISKAINNPELLPDGNQLNRKIEKLYKNKLNIVKTLYGIYQYIITKFGYIDHLKKNIDDEGNGECEGENKDFPIFVLFYLLNPRNALAMLHDYFNSHCKIDSFHIRYLKKLPFTNSYKKSVISAEIIKLISGDDSNVNSRSVLEI
ncbi:hypothetical protein Psal006b_00505 [Piscirickettsia salmonis]|uniref:6-phospho-beta-glucosidase n=1 Tax=Piscirickettsia salmonis TaxID=1238 RepID=A0A1L6TEG5_PISSA|nr:hypothetical protein [Piscirickettsia salmonis]ALB23853.1 6-phospho-beta-glucosidase [Piscirickettsia salmonis]ALY03692.1 hypothetical protein AWE47_13180 [Piscirickettsia salmonis]AMA43255.1 hypothetical protein AWJ11_13405 [Piscirickettsia salmonis]AOS35725.1 hypothetical protein AVM72_10525 [Piscirickettsia salmonis]APS60429.1 hypothetical protein AVI53_07505 [Piscirickettsia salmonis]